MSNLKTKRLSKYCLNGILFLGMTCNFTTSTADLDTHVNYKENMIFARTITGKYSGYRALSFENATKTKKIDMEQSKFVHTAYSPCTELGKKLLALRNKAIHNGMTLMNNEDILKEIKNRRGENMNV